MFINKQLGQFHNTAQRQAQLFLCKHCSLQTIWILFRTANHVAPKIDLI